jgi:homoserine O-acetyltransferase
MERALARTTAPVLTLAIDSDTLYPPYQQELIHDTLRSLGREATHVEIHSPDGHDAFLLETDAVGVALTPFLSQIEKGDR